MFLIFSVFFFTLLLFCVFVALAQWRQTRDSPILWYVGYLLATFAHYGRQFWIIGATEFGFVSPPDPPLRWDTPLSYAAFACYFLFVEQLMGVRASAPRLSKTLTGIARFFAAMIGLHLLLQIFLGDQAASQVHQALQVMLLPTLVWLTVHLLRNARLFYQKLVLIGTVALVLGYVSALATHLLDGRYDLVRTVICCFPTRWGDICLYHLKVGIALDVLCFSWALTLRQKDLLVLALLSGLPVLPAQHRDVSPPEATPEDAFLLRVREFLSQHFQQETLTVEQLAQALFLSAGQTRRKLKGKTGLTTEQYILGYRLERALHLLQTTDMPINQIALAVGLKDKAHFSRVFKKQYGQSPSETRKKRNENADKTQKNAG